MIDWLAYTLVKALSGLLCRLPPGIAIWSGEQFGLLAYWLQPRRRQVGTLNLRAAFDHSTPAQIRRILRACFKQLGAGMFELLRLPAIDRAYVERYVTIEGRRHFNDAVASGKPVVLLTGHYGNWEFSSIVAALIGYPIVALARAQNKLPRLYRLLVSYRESKGCTIIHKGGAIRRLIAAMEARRLIGIVGDQASRQGIFIDFFGRPALFATGPFELALKRGAVILPVFIHRLRGPFHRIVIEPPITLSQHLAKPDAVRQGIQRFAEALARHIQEEPQQWLWMHKRWKHTPARRVLVLSDGKAGHLKQSLAVVEAMREHTPLLVSEVIEVRYRHRLARAVCLLWSWWIPGRWGAARCLQWVLHPDTARSLLSCYADVMVSCGASTVPANVLWAAENRAKSVVIMNPAPLPLRRFDLVIVPRHDGLPARRNVIQTLGAVSRIQEEDLKQAGARLESHPKFRASTETTRRHPVVAVFLGGQTEHYELGAAFAEALIAQVMTACEAIDGWYVVTTSRRTSTHVERAVSERVSKDRRCRLCLLASRDALNGTLEGMLGLADVVVVTGDSISMVSETCASGRRAVVVEPPLRQANQSALTKHQRFLRTLAKDGRIRLAAMPDLGVAIRAALKAGPTPTKRTEDFAAIRDAVPHLL